MFGVDQFVRRTWTQVRVNLDNLDPTSKILIGSLLVILILVGFLVLQYVGKPEMVAIGGFPPEQQLAVTQRLETKGIRSEVRGTQVFVPASRQPEAFAALAESRMLTPSAMEAFDKLIERQSPWDTNQQSSQRFLLAKQQYLSVVIREFQGVKSADVMLAMPERKGFGESFVRPTASVNIVTDGSAPFNKRLVEAVAYYVAGAVAELRAEEVEVIDANNGRRWTVESDMNMLASDTLERIEALERTTLRKIEDVLRYIPGVIVAVNVQTDSVISKTVSTMDHNPNQPLMRESMTERNSQNITQGGEAGAMPNVAQEIRGSGGQGSEETYNQQETEYREMLVRRQETWNERGGMTEQMNVTVNVPRGYFVHLYRATTPDAPEQIDDEMLMPLVENQLAQIRDQVEPLVQARNPPVVRTHMIPDASMFAPLEPTVSARTGVLAVLDNDWAKPGGLGMLAVLAVGLMFYMLRQANRQPPMPTVEELAGVPPALPGDEDELIGEASAVDPAMDGVELDEAQIRSREIAEQISDMIKANPEEAGSLFNRWIRKSE